MAGVKILIYWRRYCHDIWKEVITATSRILIRYSNFRSSHRDRYKEIGKSVGRVAKTVFRSVFLDNDLHAKIENSNNESIYD